MNIYIYKIYNLISFTFTFNRLFIGDVSQAENVVINAKNTSPTSKTTSPITVNEMTLKAENATATRAQGHAP